MRSFFSSFIYLIILAALSSYVVSQEVRNAVSDRRVKADYTGQFVEPSDSNSYHKWIQPPAAVELCSDCDEPLENIFVKADRLSYNGYEIVRVHKTVVVEEIPRKLSYAVLKKNGKVIAEFDKVNSSLGNETRFGLFPLLGGKTKQLIVEQLSNRVWEYWIIELDPEFRVIYSTSDSLGRELSPFDIDGDGIFEISQSLTTFWFFDRLDNPRSPLTLINFKYDNTAKRYLPANHLYTDYVFEGTVKKLELLSRLNTEPHSTDPIYRATYLGSALNIMLRYAYAGKEDEAWTFFDQNYLLSDKHAMRSRIESQLKSCSLYKEIYNR